MVCILLLHQLLSLSPTPLSLVYSILFIPAGPRPLTLSRPRFCSFFVILRPRSVRVLPVFCPSTLSHRRVRVCMYFFISLYSIFFFSVFAFLPIPRLRFLEADISSIARQGSFLRLPDQNLENVSGTLSGRRWWHRSSIGFKHDVSAYTYIGCSKSRHAFSWLRILIQD